MEETRKKSHSVKCELLESILQTLARHKCELQKIQSDVEAVDAINKCTVSLSDCIEVNGLVKMAVDNKHLIDKLIPKFVEHGEKHPAAADRDSGIDVEIAEEGAVAMAERPFVGNCISNGPQDESCC